MWSGPFPCSPFSPNLLHVLPSGMTGLHNLWRPGHSTICHRHCYDVPSIKMWTSRDDMEALTSWIFNSWRDRNRSKLTNFSMSRPVVFVLLFEFRNFKLFPSLPEISKQLCRYISKKKFGRVRSLTGLAWTGLWFLLKWRKVAAGPFWPCFACPKLRDVGRTPVAKIGQC